MTLAAAVLAGAQPARELAESVAGKDLVLGREWNQDGEDAAASLEEFRRVAENTCARALAGEEKEDSGESWGVGVRKSERGMRRLLRAVPIPVEDENEDEEG